jgi:hypothetical protein
MTDRKPWPPTCPVCGQALEGLDRMIGLSRNGKPMSEPFLRTQPCDHKVQAHVTDLEAQEFELEEWRP